MQTGKRLPQGGAFAVTLVGEVFEIPEGVLLILDKKDCELFFAVYDALTDFANGKWGVAPAVIDPHSGFVNEENQRKVAAQLWRNKQIIDEFVEDNPYILSSDELDIARSWTNAYTDSFYAIQDESRTVYFMNDDVAFEMTGLSRAVVSMLSTIPAHVSATVLPFKDYVVHAVYLDEHPILVSSSLCKLLDDKWERMKAEGLLIKTGQQLAEAAASLEEKRISREAKRMLDSLEAEMQPDTPGEGAHRGVLAGLTAEEREVQVKEHAYAYANAETAVKELARYCMQQPPERNLMNLITKFSRNELLEVAHNMRIAQVSELDKDGVAEAIMKEMLSPTTLESMLTTMDPEDFNHVKDLYDAGGIICISADEMKSPERFCPYIPCLSYAFLHEDVFTFAMPEETYEACKGLNWESIEADQQQGKLALSVANMLVDLRGAAPLSDVYEQYQALSNDPIEIGDMALLLAYSPRDDLALYDFWFGDDPSQCYLVHSDIAASLLGNTGRMGEGSRLHMGELPSEIDDLFAVQEGKQPRPISEEMATLGEYVPWARTRPAAVALRDYLDAHVPDGENDYTFADTVLDDLIIMCTSEFPMQVITQYLSDKLALADIDQLNKIMELFTNLSSTLPKWSNNGWSPNELSEGMGRGKVFYNADGSPKRVGPYDMCPCGSGKKYKDCHGM